MMASLPAAFRPADASRSGYLANCGVLVATALVKAKVTAAEPSIHRAYFFLN